MDRAPDLNQAIHQIFRHHLYEFRKGVRPLCMMTMSVDEATLIVPELQAARVDHHVITVNDTRVNVFFGRPAVVATVRRVVTKPLQLLSPEEDFILGTLLGYDREQQCLRFLARAQR